MSPQQRYQAVSVRHLAARVERIAPRDPASWEGRERVPLAGGVLGQVSRQRADQLWALVGMFDRAVGRPEMPGRASRTAEQLFTWAALRPFWELAAAGELRHVARNVGRPLPLASLRIVRDCLSILARVVVPGKRVRLPSVPEPGLKPTVGGRSLVALYRGLVDLAAAGPLGRDGTGLSFEDRTRLLAMVAIVLDAAPRRGELAAMTLDDVAGGEVAVAVRRRPQKAGPNRAEEIAALAEVRADTVRAVLWGQVERMSYATRHRVLAAIDELEPLPEVEWYALREGSRVAVRRWLSVRQDIVDRVPLEGAKTALWVTLSATHLGPPGLPITALRLGAAYVRGITALNWVMAGEYGWEPMPTRLEQLRRSVDVTRLDGPPEA